MRKTDPPSFFAKVSSEISEWGKMFTEIGKETSSWFTTEKPKQTVIKNKEKKSEQTGGPGALPFSEGNNPLDRTGIYRRN